VSTCPVRKPLHLLELRRLNMADFISQRWLLNRREVLRGLGVSLACRCSNACSHCEAPGRMLGPVAVSSSTLPNGVNTNDFEMEKAGKDYELSRILKPLEKHQASITPISGLYHPNSFGIAHSVTQTWLTGAKHGPTGRTRSRPRGTRWSYLSSFSWSLQEASRSSVGG
jgi:hypothetical protein